MNIGVYEFVEIYVCRYKKKVKTLFTVPSTVLPIKYKRRKRLIYGVMYYINRTRSRNRTGTRLLSLVFETNASTYSAIRAKAPTPVPSPNGGGVQGRGPQRYSNFQ